MNTQQENKATTDNEVQPLEIPGVFRPLPPSCHVVVRKTPVLTSRNDLGLVHLLTLLGTG